MIEKYVSIEYNKWHNHYKPIEEKYDKVVSDMYKLSLKQLEEMMSELKRQASTGMKDKDGFWTTLIYDEWGRPKEFYTYIKYKDIEEYRKVTEEKLSKIPKWIRKIFGA